MAVSACQSLREALDQLAEDETQPNPKLKTAISKLPHVHLIENIRNMDLHGWPLPICDPKVRMVAMVSKPGKPIELSSSHVVGVSLRMAGVKPKVHRTPNRVKHGKRLSTARSVAVVPPGLPRPDQRQNAHRKRAGAICQAPSRRRVRARKGTGVSC